ncbi:MAG: glutamate-1-semialdehyde 2,1-aminomutase, partial [Candidatus Azotimanducaceae bacterium]
DVVFSERLVKNYREHQSENSARNKTFNDGMRQGGILKAPGKIYTSLTLNDADFDVLEAAINLATAKL